ncbi:hypothetical protein CFAM422_008577 [Trichoderma lentiforme]|uniref:Uncharacterized protein n=1 Tax=Trichoderma lentiforme TaxID=1567552 RepID=A0A9P4X9N6_9HYPO|nr:hypothetical protein CFAM422_008577 [Trichoderma lentiforme]
MSLWEKDYAPLGRSSAEDSTKSDDGIELEMLHLPSRRWTQSLLFQALPWILTLVFMVISFAQYELRDKPCESEEHSLLRPTDFSDMIESASSEIELEIVTFTGAPVFMENGTFHVPNPGKTTYTGPPSPEIDSAWEEITAGRYFRITAEEAIEAFGSASNVYWNDKVGGYMAGYVLLTIDHLSSYTDRTRIDMFHALHCLNRLRQSFWPDYYPPSTHPNTIIHQEHCIDHIRQMLMCSGDMTLIPTEWTDYLGRNYVNSDVPHTCRNFAKLRDWVVSRHNGSTMVPESSVKHHGKGQGQ